MSMNNKFQTRVTTLPGPTDWKDLSPASFLQWRAVAINDAILLLARRQCHLSQWREPTRTSRSELKLSRLFGHSSIRVSAAHISFCRQLETLYTVTGNAPNVFTGSSSPGVRRASLSSSSPLPFSPSPSSASNPWKPTSTTHF